MFISTKGRYALKVMIDLAQRRDDAYVPLREIAQREGISEKYLEIILKKLVCDKLLTGLRGKGGGYRLNREPEEYTVGEILRSAEDTLTTVSCLDGSKNGCSRAADCPTFPVWQQLDKLINDFLDGIKLSDLLSGELTAPSA